MREELQGATTFAAKLRQLLDETGETVRDFAAILGISPQAASQYQLGKSEPNIERIIKIADHFNVSIDWLLGRPGAAKTLDAEMQSACRVLCISQNAAEQIKALSFLPTKDGGEMSEHIAFDLFMQNEFIFDFFSCIAEMYKYSTPETIEEQHERETVECVLKETYGEKFRLVSRKEAFTALKQNMLEIAGAIASSVANYDGDIPQVKRGSTVTISLYEDNE